MVTHERKLALLIVLGIFMFVNSASGRLVHYCIGPIITPELEV